MYKKILVPLDGSTLASSILPHVRAIVHCTHAQLILLRATPNPIYRHDDIDSHQAQQVGLAPRTLDGTAWRLQPDPAQRTEWIEHEVEAAQRYLDEVVGDFARSGIQARALIQPGAAAEVILDTADREGVDLIAMSTHGRSGIGRFLMGSVADRVLHHSQLPMLLVRPDEPDYPTVTNTSTPYQRILVPLDGSSLANSILPHVRELAQCSGSQVLLLRVSPNPRDWPDDADAFAFTGGLLGIGQYASNDSQALEYEQDQQTASTETRRAIRAEHIREAAQSSLDAAASDLLHAGLQVETLIQVGTPAETILDVAESCGADMIAMSTHGRSGLRRFLMGSVAGRVLGYATVPVLLMRNPST